MRGKRKAWRPGRGAAEGGQTDVLAVIRAPTLSQDEPAGLLTGSPAVPTAKLTLVRSSAVRRSAFARHMKCASGPWEARMRKSVYLILLVWVSPSPLSAPLSQDGPRVFEYRMPSSGPFRKIPKPSRGKELLLGEVVGCGVETIFQSDPPENRPSCALSGAGLLRRQAHDLTSPRTGLCAAQPLIKLARFRIAPTQDRTPRRKSCADALTLEDTLPTRWSTVHVTERHNPIPCPASA